MLPMRRILLLFAMASWQASHTAAFQSNNNFHLRRWAATTRTTTMTITMDQSNHLDEQSFHIATMDGDRRSFLKNTLGAMLTPLMLPWPSPALADSTDEVVANETLEKVDQILKDEIELNDTVIQEEKDELKLIEDEKQLISELEKEIQIEGNESSTLDEVTEEAQRIQGETEALIEEQEKLKSETEDMIVQIEAMESEVNSLDSNVRADEGNEAGDKKASEVFVEKLKERVEQKEDLITRLKRQSERDIDPKTGKFKTMTPSEYKERVKSTDVDFLQFLKDTVANEQELQNDMEAFQGLLERKFGPVARELRKDLTPIVGEVRKDMGPIVDEMENQLRKEVAPVVLDGMEQLKDKARMAVDSDVADMKERAEDLIGKLRSLF